MTEFVHLHVHTDYSLLDGASSVSALVEKAKKLGMQHLAITDHGNMFGALRFFNECVKQGLNPVVGNEFYMAGGSRFERTGTEYGNKYYHLVLLAMNEEGYRNLTILTSRSFTEGYYYKPRIDEELLRTYHGGLICLSACLAGEIPQDIMAGKIDKAEERARSFLELFGEGNFYLELQDHGIPEQKTVNKAIIEISEKTGIPLVATNDLHYADPDKRPH